VAQVIPSLTEAAESLPPDQVHNLVAMLVLTSLSYTPDDAPDELIAELEMARDLEGIPEHLTNAVCAELARIVESN
jgi:hypothetical protein